MKRSEFTKTNKKQFELMSKMRDDGKRKFKQNTHCRVTVYTQ
jgi:hypothetical protein